MRSTSYLDEPLQDYLYYQGQRDISTKAAQHLQIASRHKTTYHQPDAINEDTSPATKITKRIYCKYLSNILGAYSDGGSGELRER